MPHTPITPLSTLGILPVGALGAAFFYHLTNRCTERLDLIQFIDRRGSTSNASRAQHGLLSITSSSTSDAVHTLPTEQICRADLIECARAGWIPDVILVCTQPDQLLPVIGDYVKLLEQLFRDMGLQGAVARLPLLVLSSNGIYHERVRRFLVEVLEESMLFGRLPDLWSDSMGLIVGKLLRGVTVQTGYREGTGAQAVFYAGTSARTTIAGGDAGHRVRCAKWLTSLGGWFEFASNDPPIRVEFDKALINLWSNLLGQIKAIDEHGNFRLLKIREIYEALGEKELHELSGHLFAVGRAVRAYQDDEDFESIHQSAFHIASAAGEHYPSSLKWIESQIVAGTLQSQLTPTEKWLLDPLIHYSRTAGLEDAANYFQGLQTTLEQRLELCRRSI
jgi:hypothetical protein